MKSNYAVAALLFFFSLNTLSQNISSIENKLPVDSNVTIGKLENGLTYYLRYNKKPENRLFLRLVLNAGSILEEENQKGLAHFVEHMAFNGTKHFAKNEIINYMESIGMRFGADVNASTSFDETVYMIEVPTDSLETVVKGLSILKDWASALSFDSLEIEKERGVITEEWRLGRGANARVFDKQAPILFKNSRYAERLPIGDIGIISSFEHETLKKFYRDWYRPDLMAVVAVGDIDKNWLEKTITALFSEIPKVSEQKERIIYPIPDIDEVLFSINSDPELPQSSISLYYKFPIQKIQTIKDYKEELVQSLYNGMLNSRLSELTQNPEPPFLYAYSSKGNFIRSKSFSVLGAVPKEDSLLLALKSLLTESERVRQSGFTEAELNRQKAEMLRGLEVRFNEKENTKSNVYVNQYSLHYLNSNPIPGIDFQYEITKTLLPEISLQDVNKVANTLFSDNNYVVLVSVPEKLGLILPSEEELRKTIIEVKKNRLSEYKETLSSIALIETPLKKANINSENKVEDLGITELELENGVRVILKPTDFKKDEIVFRAFSDGGTSLVNDEDYIPAATATSIVTQSGVGNMNLIELQKFLKGKVVNVSPYIGELAEGLNGSVSVKDIETMFQLIYLNFVSPRCDSSAFLSYRTRLENYLKNRDKDPELAFRDSVNSIISQYHPRRKPWTAETLDKLNPQKSFAIFKDRFADASDFTFIFVGAFSVDSIKPLIQTYLGNLPATNRKEHWKNIGVLAPKGIIRKEVLKGIENKCIVNLIFTGDFNWDPWEIHKFSAMIDVMNIKLREVIREEMSGTYGVSVNHSLQKLPLEKYMTAISFGCNPDRADELIKTVFDQIDSMKSIRLDEIYLTKVKETQRREWEENLKENNFWVNRLWTYYLYDYDLEDFFEYGKRIEKLNPEIIKNAVKEYFNMENFIQVVLKPEQNN
ncbi:MAG: insulinase family protein [Ignavibacteriaceae bacterium]|nr:insulinase family protein [Ignavibacteriaceae bacterium]